MARILGLAAAASLLATAGCAQMAILFMVDTEPKVPAEFKLPKGKTALLIDDYMVDLDGENIKEQMAAKMAELLQTNRAVEKAALIPYETVKTLKTEAPDGRRYSIQRLGKELGAENIIYINISQFELQSDPDSPLIRPAGAARVKVIAVGTGERLWPVDLAGQSVQAQGRREAEVLEAQSQQKWTETLADMLATDVAELFYEHRKKS